MDHSMDYLVVDGGFATEVAWTHGHQYIDNDPLWSAKLLATNIDVLKAVHLSFLESGADIIETSSYQASIEGFVKYLSVDKEAAFDLIVKSGKIANDVRDEYWKEKPNKGRLRPLVAGSLGPYGAHLHDCSEYSGTYVDNMTEEELQDWHRPQIAALTKGGVDLLAFDSIPALKEATAIARVLGEFPFAKAWISFTCKDKEHICHGEKLCDSLSALVPYEQIVAVGINCTPPQYISDLLKLVPEPVKEKKKIIVYPNSGEEWLPEKKWSGNVVHTPFNKDVTEWLELGANWIGGCCRVTPSDIAGVRDKMDAYLKSR